MADYPDTLLLIDGVWRKGAGGEGLPVLNPATGHGIGSVARAEPADLDEALAAAAKGFAIWSATPAHDRALLIRKAATLLAERSEAIARILTLEQGKRLIEARYELAFAVENFNWYAEEARRLYGRLIPARGPGISQKVMRFPIGPVAAFTPWNFPVNQIVHKLGAALASGCSILIKGPEETPASGAAMVQCFVDAGLPPGVVGLVFGIPAEISAHLIASPVIRKVSFTGSTQVGRLIAAQAGQYLKSVTLELGGHAPVIIAADADLDRAADVMAGSKFLNAGQVCASPTRFLVHESLAEGFAERLGDRARALAIGDGLDPATGMGPLANPRRIDEMERLIPNALAAGGRLHTGGNRIGNDGFFFQPTILTDVPASARIMNAEPFGPVAVINRFGTLEEAIAEANRLPWGLASYAFTRATATVEALEQGVRAGMLSINHNGLALAETPFGGIGDSGQGSEGGAEALNAFTVPKFVTLAA